MGLPVVSNNMVLGIYASLAILTISRVTSVTAFHPNSPRKHTSRRVPPLPSFNDILASSFRETDNTLDRDEHVRILNDNLERHIGKGLRDFTETSCDVAGCYDDIHTCTRFALLSNGSKNDLDGPVNNYGNFGALGAFQMTYSQLTAIPAGRMARLGLDQEEWSQVLQKLRDMEKEGFLQSYKGFLCTVNQIPFFLRDAMIWNCFDDKGEYYGQAAFFDRDKVTFMDNPSLADD